jgi:carbon-monoxide dehydrogenase large subunit
MHPRMTSDTRAVHVVGSPVERIEDLRLLRGRGKYVDDLHLDGMLHAAVLRSSVAHGRIRSIDVGAARNKPGVHAVFTAADILRACDGAMPTIPLRRGPLPGMEPFEQPVIGHLKVRYVGEPLAVVVADSAALAEDALEAIVTDIESLPAVPDRRASENGNVFLFEQCQSNIAVTYIATRGDVKSVDAPYRRREKLTVQRHTAVSMEPRGLVADWNGTAIDKLTVAGAAKVPFATRRILARCMKVPESSIDMLEYDVGGGFGIRGDFYPEDFLIPFAARQIGRPVKWIEDRRENLISTSHAREAECDIEIACAKDGTVLALSASIAVDMGAYVRNSAEVAPRNAALFLSGPYRIPNIQIESSMVLTNKSPVGTYRGPGRFEADFFRERMFDMAAKDLGIDRVEFRRRNLVRETDMPYPIATISPLYGEAAVVFDGGDYRVALDRCLAEIKWPEKAALQGKLIDGRYHGLGLGCFIESGGAGPRENARLAVDEDGTVSLFVGSSNIGQGLETVCVQIAADALQLPMHRIKVFHGSTTYLKEGFGSFASRSTVMGGSAILDAADNLKAKVRAAAGRRFNCAADEVTIGDALSASYEGKTLALAELANDDLSAEGTFATTQRTYAYGAAAAHVAVDPDTGRVELVDYVTVEDVGRIINPLTVKGQAVGAVVQGLGGTLMEHLQYDEQGQCLTASLADYMMPTATDFPKIRAIELEISRSPHNPLGAKGAGEGGIIPVGGVIANAVAAALAPLGVEPRSLPLSPDRLWKVMQAAR